MECGQDVLAWIRANIETAPRPSPWEPCGIERLFGVDVVAADDLPDDAWRFVRRTYSAGENSEVTWQDEVRSQGRW
jgi:hypothetical protein